MTMEPFEEKPFPHSDAVIISMCMKAVSEYASQMYKSLSPFKVEDCVARAVNSYKEVYRKARGYSRNAPLSRYHTEEMQEIFRRIGPALEEKARTAAMRRAVGIKTKAIGKVTAEAAVKAEAERLGYTCRTIPQCYRIKVIFTIQNKYEVMLIILYRDILAGRLPEIMSSFGELTELLKKGMPCEVYVSRHRARK